METYSPEKVLEFLSSQIPHKTAQATQTQSALIVLLQRALRHPSNKSKNLFGIHLVYLLEMFDMNHLTLSLDVKNGLAQLELDLYMGLYFTIMLQHNSNNTLNMSFYQSVLNITNSQYVMAIKRQTYCKIYPSKYRKGRVRKKLLSRQVFGPYIYMCCISIDVF